MTAPDLIGYTAAIVSTSSFVPQVWKVVRSGDTEAISSRMYVLTVGGFALWTVYGWLEASWPLVVSNTICLLLAAYILFRKRAAGRSDHRQPDQSMRDAL